MAMKNWVVPVTMKDSYWIVRLYIGDGITAAFAKEQAQAAMDALALYVKPPQPFIVGEPEEIR